MRTVDYVRPCLKDMQEFPDDVKAIVAHALTIACEGGKHPDTKPLTGFPGTSIMEISLRDDGNAYRVVYTLEFPGLVCVIHAFQKKSHQGIHTPRQAINLIIARLKALRALHRQKGKQK